MTGVVSIYDHVFQKRVKLRSFSNATCLVGRDPSKGTNNALSFNKAFITLLPEIRAPSNVAEVI